jgi:hypothetical protein
MLFLVIKKMNVCEECGTKLGVFEGYRHPTMGKKHHLCSPCFDQVSESVARWREFVLSGSFNMEMSNNNLQLNFKDLATNFYNVDGLNVAMDWPGRK